MATTSSKISADQFLTNFMQLDDIQWKTESLAFGVQIDTRAQENYSSWLKSYDVTLRAFKNFSKQNISSDAETQKRMEHFKKKLSKVEGALFGLTITNAQFKQYLPSNYLYALDNPQYLHKDTKDTVEDAAKKTVEPAPNPVVPPASATAQPALAPSSSSSSFVPPGFSPIPGLGTFLQSQANKNLTGPASFPPPAPFTPPGSAPGTNLNTTTPRSESPLAFSMMNIPPLAAPLSTTSGTTLQPLARRQIQQLTPPQQLVMSPYPGCGAPPMPVLPGFASSTLTPAPSLYSSNSSLYSSSSSAMQPMALPIPELDKKTPMDQPIPERLSVISYLLRSDEETEALRLFSELPAHEIEKIYHTLWTVRGKPMPGNPIHHDNFGEASFLNLVDRCKSTPMQKACAIEIYKTQSEITKTIVNTIESMGILLGKGDTVEYKILFNQLPREIQNAIMKTHWEVCGRPMPGNPIHHDNFGKVSFLAEEKRCDVPNAKRIATLQAVHTSIFSESLKEAYDIGACIPAKIQEWKRIDEDHNCKGAEKNIAKKNTLHALAKQIVPLFLPKEAAIPAVSTDSFEALAAAYVKEYPFLKEYFLLMIPYLRENVS